MDETSIEDPQGLHQVSSLPPSSFSSLYFSFMMSRLVVVVRCVSTCWETVINITPWSLNVFTSIQVVSFYERARKRVKETSEPEPVQTLIDGHSRYRSCVFFLYSLLSLLIVTNAQIHTTCSIAVVGSRGHLAIVDFNQLPSFYELQYKQKSNRIFYFLTAEFFAMQCENENFKLWSYLTGLLQILLQE